MALEFFKRMNSRVEYDKENSDTDYFQSLLYYGELLTKVVVSGLVASVVDGKDQSQYSLRHRLVRANGIGEWSTVLDEILLGPTATKVVMDAQKETTELTKKVKADEWQYQAVSLLYNVACTFDDQCEDIGKKVSLKSWFSLFAFLRNKTRGHGAPSSNLLSTVCQDLASSIEIIVENYCLFNREWIYLRQNLSGKYRVHPLSGFIEEAGKLTSSEGKKYVYPEGIYIAYDKLRPVHLIQTENDLKDFFFPNGSFTGKKYECLSYRSGEKKHRNSQEYATPPGRLNKSETKASLELTILGNAFSNMPEPPTAYIERAGLEKEINDLLLDDRNPVITLLGRGGIGKTTTALKVLHELVQNDKYGMVLWFSARDIDLFERSPIKVAPDVLTIDDIANDYAKLTDPEERALKAFNPVECFKEGLQQPILDTPSIFVFDNFETTKDPVELYHLINTHIRLPNKVVITTRHRDFKGDYPVHVSGMEKHEAFALIDDHAAKLGISDLINDAYRNELFRESDGHPYIIKVLLGEVKKAGDARKVERVVARKDDMLDALFERTFKQLSAPAKRTFITLSNWRSELIPKVAFEAVMLRPENDSYDVEASLVEVENCSFAETIYDENDDLEYIFVPLTAKVFGRKKLSVSTYKPSVEIDTKYLQLFGATQRSGVQHGFEGKIYGLVQHVKKKVASQEELEKYIPILKYVANQYNRTWLIIADLVIESGNNVDDAINAVKSFIENSSDLDEKFNGWDKLRNLCHKINDYDCLTQCLYEICNLPGVHYKEISFSAKQMNRLLSEKLVSHSQEEKRHIIQSIIDRMEEHKTKFDGDDYSRLAWLYMSMQQTGKAESACRHGLEKDEKNEHCYKLLRKLSS